MKHYEIKELNGPPSRADRDREHPEDYGIEWAGRDEAAPPEMITTQEGDNERHFIVYAAHDIFCLASNDWGSLTRSQHAYMISAPFVGDEFDILEVKNIALQFDPSWNRYLPDKIADLSDEKFARGFFANMLSDLAFERWFACPNLWLIDNSAGWSAEPGQDVIAYDCHGEYVEIGWDDNDYYDLCEEEEPSSAAFFLRELVHLGGWDLKEINEEALNRGWSHGAYGYERSRYRMKSLIRLLVRRDNQVKTEKAIEVWIEYN